LIKGPFMLEIGLAPQSAVATAVFMIFFTSSTTSFQFALLGALDPKLSVVFSVIAFLGSLIGTALVASLVARLKRQSIVTFLLAGLIFLSMLSMIAVGTSRLLSGEHPKEVSLWAEGLGAFCAEKMRHGGGEV